MFSCSNEIEEYKCQLCPDFETSFYTSFNCHIRENHINKSAEAYSYKCLKCSFITFSKYLIVRHSFFGKCATRSYDGTEKRFVCDRNGQLEFYSLKNKPRKQRVNADRAKPSKCLSKLKAKSNNKKPIKSCNPNPGGTSWLYCDQCVYKCQKKNNLTRHIRCCHTDHKDIKWFNCEYCSSKFKRRDDLKRHTLACHTKPEDIPWFGCEECSYKTKRKEHLKLHVTACHTDPKLIKWYKCKQCTSRFKRKSSLPHHIKLFHDKSEPVGQDKPEESEFKSRKTFTKPAILRRSRP